MEYHSGDEGNVKVSFMTCLLRRKTQQQRLEKVILKDFFILMDRDCLQMIQIFQRFNEVIGSLVDIN